MIIDVSFHISTPIKKPQAPVEKISTTEFPKEAQYISFFLGFDL